jgi:two-component system, NarL family, response regulator NreC
MDTPGTYFCTKCGAIQKHTDLSLSEVEVLRAYALGLTTAEIAHIRFVSIKTVESQRTRMIEKLGVPNLVAAVVWGIRVGLIYFPPSAV